MNIIINKSNPHQRLKYSDLVRGQYFIFCDSFEAAGSEVCPQDINLKLHNSYLQMKECSERDHGDIKDMKNLPVYLVRGVLTVEHDL